MTNAANDLPAGVHLVSTPPTRLDANNKGDVLWFCPKHGWYRGWFQNAHFNESSHWAKIPDEPDVPTVKDVVADREAAFERWMDQFPTELDPAVTALMKSGFVGGYTYRGQP